MIGAASLSTLRVGHMEGYDGTKSPYFDTNVAVSYDVTQDSYVCTNYHKRI